MNSKIVGLWAILMVISISSFSQEEFSDEDLTKYATVMKWAELEKDNLSAAVSDAINGNESLPGSVYKALKDAEKSGDLASAEATDEQVAEYTRIMEMSENLKAEFKETYTTKIKEDIGAGLYNSLKKALKADDSLNQRYQAIYDAIEIPSSDEAENSDEVD